MINDLSTEDHAIVIADSITNGQNKQARRQFLNAMAEDCTAKSLCLDIESAGIPCEKITLLLCSLIDKD